MHRRINAARGGLSWFHFSHLTISSKCTLSVRIMRMEEAILDLQILTTNNRSHFKKTVIPQEIRPKIPNLKPRNLRFAPYLRFSD